MLDPRTLGERRDEILESCRRRRVAADVDGAIALHREVTALQTELNEVNRRRNEHQASGKRKMEPAQREAHTAEGRALKESVARVEAARPSTGPSPRSRTSSIPRFPKAARRTSGRSAASVQSRDSTSSPSITWRSPRSST